MPSTFSHGPVSQIAFRTPISAVHKSTTNECVIKVFFQDVLGGIRFISHDNVWNGGTSAITTAKLGTPLSVIATPSLDKVRLYFFSPENKLRELCYDQDRGGSWYEGALSAKDIEVAPYSQVAAIHLTNSQDQRVYVQLPNDTIQEYSYDHGSPWYTGTNLGDALSGTSIAAVDFGARQIRAYFQKTDLSLTGTGTNGESWFDLGFSIPNSPVRGPIALVSYPTTGKPGYGKRLYYTTAGNRIKEKIYNTYEPGSSGNGWSDGTLDISTIPGSNFDAICWNESSNISLRVYVQEGQQASAISEWIRDRDFAPGWALGIAALPPATQ